MKNIFILAILSLTSLQIFGETKVDLDEKWNKMVSKANTYQEYKVIKISELNSMWKLVQDHVKSQDMGMANEKNILDRQKVKIANLEKQTIVLNQKIDQISTDKESINFLKFTFNKYNYTTFLWLFIGLTVVSSAVLFFLFNRSNKITVQKINDFTELSKAFEEHKQSKIESERKLKRELQTYMNKSEESNKDKAGFGRGN